MKRRLVIALLALIFGGACTPAQIAQLRHAPTAPTCQEDDPCWNCHTMGNRVCGNETPVTVIGQAAAVAG